MGMWEAIVYDVVLSKMKVSPGISTSQFSEDVSGETLIFKIRGLRAAFTTSHFFEDVSGESPIFEDPKIRPAISTSRFCEDVSGETTILRTFADMSGKRVKGKSCA